MKNFVVIDCGTTNSRVYLLNKNREVIAKNSMKVGVKDTALSGNRDKLQAGLQKLIEETIFSVGLSLKDISFAITSGMITSEIGLVEIPHLCAPIKVDDLAFNIKVIKDPKIFPLDIPLYFIRGVKNYFPENVTYQYLRKIDFMRGEETQVAGLLDSNPTLNLPLTVVILSSHTKYIYIDKDKQINGSLTTLSGQIYEAIKESTSIGKSVQCIKKQKIDDYFNTDIIDIAYDSVVNAGFLRTLMMPRFMDVLLKTTSYERDLFLNAAISTEDLIVLNEFKNMNFSLTRYFILIGHKNRCDIFSYLLHKHHKIKNKNIKYIYDEKDISTLNVKGAIYIANKGGYLN
jgi:2-dehydro-3-deoxygalactonokinase